MTASQWTIGPAHRYYGEPMSAPAVPWLPDGSWSRYHAACVGHGGTELPHVAHGLCKRCHSARLREQERIESLEYPS